MNERLKILVRIAPIVLILDQVTKFLVTRILTPGSTYPVIGGFFDIVHHRNPGAAFGTLSSLSPQVRLPFFLIASTIALALILIYFFRLKEATRWTLGNLALIVGGALGNIIDRVFRGEVVDFLSFHWRNRWVLWDVGWFRWHFKLEWPAFNVADASITVAVVGLMILMMREKKQ